MIDIFKSMFAIYLFIVVFASGTDIIYGNITGVENIYSPISTETGKLILVYVICNIALSLLTVLFLLKRCDQHISMICYEFKNNNRSKLLYSQKRDLYKCVIAAVGAKFIIDLVCAMWLRVFDWGTLVCVTLSYILTSILWLDMIYTLRMFKVSSNITFFAVIVGVFISLLLQRTLTLTLFAYCVSEDFIYDYLVKVVLIILLQVLEINKIKKSDLY